MPGMAKISMPSRRAASRSLCYPSIHTIQFVFNKNKSVRATSLLRPLVSGASPVVPAQLCSSTRLICRPCPYFLLSFLHVLISRLAIVIFDLVSMCTYVKKKHVYKIKSQYCVGCGAA